MACSSNPSRSTLDRHLPEFFSILSQPNMWNYFFKAVELGFAGATLEETDLFPHRLTFLVRYYNASLEYLTFHINSCLVIASTPYEMFRTDSIHTRMLREFVTQAISPALASHLSLVVSSLSLPLPLTAIEVAATQILCRLHQFRFSSEAKALFVTLGLLIDQKFPGSQRIGISGIFFLRYLCPLILSSPSSFAAESTEMYQKNSLQLVKILQNIANRTTTTNATPETLMVAMEQQELMTNFLSRLASATDSSGFKLSFSLYSNLAVTTKLDDSLYIELVDLMLKWTHLSELDHRWVLFSETWKEFIIGIKDIESLASDSSSSEHDDDDPPKPMPRPPKHRFTPPLLSFLSFSRKSRSGSQISIRVSSVSDFQIERRSSIGTSDRITGNRISRCPPLSKKSSSASALQYSPRTESLRASFTLQIDSARSLLSSIQAMQHHGGDLLQILGSIAGLAQRLATSIEQRHVLLKYAQLVSQLVDELNDQNIQASTMIDLNTILSRLERTFIDFTKK